MKTYFIVWTWGHKTLVNQCKTWALSIRSSLKIGVKPSRDLNSVKYIGLRFFPVISSNKDINALALFSFRSLTFEGIKIYHLEIAYTDFLLDNTSKLWIWSWSDDIWQSYCRLNYEKNIFCGNKCTTKHNIKTLALTNSKLVFFIFSYVSIVKQLLRNLLRKRK